MSRLKRPKGRKRGLPDWMGDDDDCDPETVVNKSDDTQSHSSAQNKKPETGNEQRQGSEVGESRTKKPFVRPKYEYLSGNKYSQKNQIGVPLKNPEVVTGDSTISLSAEEKIALSMPYIKYTGVILYSYNANDCSLMCDEIIEHHLNILADKTKLNVGFDLEWPVSFTKGEGSGKVALVQISIDESKCYLFHVSAMGVFPKALKRLVEDKRMVKIGVNIENDMWKLAKDFDIDAMGIIRNSLVDLGQFANSKMKSREHWSLEGLCRNVLRMRMDKDGEVRCGKWDSYHLDEKQKMYAAVDAYASLKIYNTLCSKYGNC